MLAPPNFTGVTSPSTEDGLDAQGLRQYRLSLAVASRRFKHYPRQALEQGWSGTAEVSVALVADGIPPAVQLLRSSGHDVLDAVALEMVGNAARNTAVPSSLRGRSFRVPLPVEFRRDAD
jgi:protein TonB